MTKSNLDNYVKIWNIKNITLITEIQYVGNNEFLSCFLNFNEQIYVVTSNHKNTNEPFNVFDLQGNIINKFNLEDNLIYSLDTYYDEKTSKTFLIISSELRNLSYDCNENKIYNVYINCVYSNILFKFIIINDEGVIKILGVGPIIKVWSFHTGKLLDIIDLNSYSIQVCLWNNQYLISVSNSSKKCLEDIKLIDLKEKKTYVLISGIKNSISLITKVTHPLYGDCLLAKSNNSIILYATDKYLEKNHNNLMKF